MTDPQPAVQAGPQGLVRRWNRSRRRGIIAAVALALALVVAGLVAAAAGESQRMEQMMSIARQIPEGRDWQLAEATDPTHNLPCLMSGHGCHSLSRTWHSRQPISVKELDTATGHKLEPMEYRTDCAYAWVGDVRVQLCVNGRDVELTMTDR